MSKLRLNVPVSALFGFECLSTLLSAKIVSILVLFCEQSISIVYMAVLGSFMTASK